MTAWHLAAPALPNEMKINAVGEGVSLRHSGLTKALCERTGAPVNSAAGELRPWLPVVADDAVYLPLDASMLSFACLAAMVSGATVQINGVPAEEDALGNEVLIVASSLGLSITQASIEYVGEAVSTEVNLQHANDLITPLAALMALGGGGRITGASHAAFKETDRTHGTTALLAQLASNQRLKTASCSWRAANPSPTRWPRANIWRSPNAMTALVLAMGAKAPFWSKAPTCMKSLTLKLFSAGRRRVSR